MKKINIKRLAAGAVAAVMAAGLTGCGENTTWGADIDGARIPAGVLIYFLQTSYYDAQSKLYSQSTDESGEGMNEIDVYTSDIEGKNGKDWVYEDATKQMQIYAAIESKFDEYGLSLTAEETEAAQLYCDQLWENSGEYYNKMGISQKSYQSVYLNNAKRSKVFEHLYLEGGEYGVPDSDIKSYLDENYALINYIDIELKDGEGNLLKSDGKAERMAMAEEYVSRFKNGEDFDALNAEYVTYYKNLQEEAAAKAAEDNAADTGNETDGAADDGLFGELAEVEESAAQASNAGDGDEIPAEENENTDNTEVSEDPAATEAAEENSETDAGAGDNGGDNAGAQDGSGDDNAAGSENSGNTENTENDGNAENSGNAADGENAEGGADSELGDFNVDDLISVDTVDSNRRIIEKEGGDPNETVAAKVFGEMKKGDIEIIETPDGEHYFVVARYDILEDDSYFEAAKTSLLFEMKEEDYDSVIDSWTAQQSVAKNEESYKRYDPKKIIGG